MRLIALETSDPVGSLAALAEGDLLGELRLPADRRTAQSLAPSLKRLLELVGWRPADVQVVAVTIGPGPFTGLRIGVTTAKALAYSVKAEIIGIDTLEAIAAGCPQEVAKVAAAVDAQRGEVVAGTLARGDDGWFAPCGPWELVGLEAWLARLPPGMAVTGPMLSKVRQMPRHLHVLDPRYWSPTAAAVGRLAARVCAAGYRDDVWSLVPKYYRRSAAEEKLDAQLRR